MEETNNVNDVELTEEGLIALALETAKNNTKMNLVKMDVTCKDNNLTMIYRQGVDKGEKFDREKSDIFRTCEYDLTQLPEKILYMAARHGLKQKMCDNLAMRKEDKEKTSVKDAVSISDDLWKQLVAGDWNAVGKNTNPDIIKVDTKLAKEGLANMTDEQREQALALAKMLGITLS